MTKTSLEKTDKEEYLEIKEKMPDFVKYVEKKYHDALITVILAWIFATIVFIIVGLFFGRFLVVLGILYGLIGTYLWAKGSLRKPIHIVSLCAMRFGYSKPLADEFITSSKETGVAIFLIVLSLIIQAYLILILPA